MGSKYTFKRETTVVLEYGDTLYYLDALGDYTFSQTFEKRRISRKTIHNKSPKPLTVVTGKNPGSASLSVYATTTLSEKVLLTLAGLQETLFGYELPYNLAVEPEYFHIYIISTTNTTRLFNCAITSLDTMFSKAANVVLETSISFSDIHQGVELPDVPIVLQGNIPEVVNELIVETHVYDHQFTNVKNTSFSIQQQYNWRQDNNIQTIGDVYIPTKAILDDMPINAVVTAYYNNTSVIPDIVRDISLTISFGIITINLTNILLTKRLESQDVLEVQYDISLQEESSVVVEYGEIPA